MSTLVSNKRARFDYDIKDKWQAGLVLTGSEVKSVKASHASLTGSFIKLQNDEAWLANAYIAPYQNSSVETVRRSRKLLLTQRELRALAAAKHGSLDLVPLRLFTVRGLVKVELAAGRSRRHTDKRQVIATREARRQADRAIKSR